MDSSSFLPGIFAIGIFGSAVLTLFVSMLLLWLYRRATLLGMARASNESSQQNSALSNTVQESNSITTPPAELRFLEIKDSSGDARLTALNTDDGGVLNGNTTLNRIRRSQRQTALVHIAGGFAYALVMTLIWLVIVGAMPSIGRVLMLMTLFMWPTAITLCIVYTIGAREYLMVLGGYILLLLATIVIVVQRNPEIAVGTTLLLWAMINLPPSLFFLFILRGRLRSVGPMVFIFTTCGFIGAALSIYYSTSGDSALYTITRLGQLIGLGAIPLLILLFVAGFSLFALVGHYLLRQLGKAYQHKLFSDRTIVTDSIWLMFSIVQSSTFTHENELWILASPLAFIAYRVVVSVGYRITKSRNAATREPMELLLLRVFSLGQRSNRLFDKFSKLWREVGVINMIAGPDLVTATIEPHEFLEFASGKLSRRFVLNEADLNQRILDRDRQPDPDGRFRVHEFFCHDDTWKITMHRLAKESDAILMDLRSFTASNQGCLYELKVLVDSIDLHRIVFIVDKTTDRAFLHQSFLKLWSELSWQSPNREQSHPVIRLFAAGHNNRKAIRNLIAQLLMHVDVPRPDTSTRSVHQESQEALSR